MNRIFVCLAFVAGLSVQAVSVPISGFDNLRISDGALNSQQDQDFTSTAAPGLGESSVSNVARATLNHPLPSLHNVTHLIDGYDLNHEISVLANSTDQQDIMAWSVRIDGEHMINGRKLAETGAKSNLESTKTANETDMGGERNEFYDDGISTVLSRIFGG